MFRNFRNSSGVSSEILKVRLHISTLNVSEFPFNLSNMLFWCRRYAERIWGEFFILVRRILGKLPANFSANFDGEF